MINEKRTTYSAESLKNDKLEKRYNYSAHKGRGTIYHKIGPLSEIDFIQPILFLHIGKVKFTPNYSIKIGFGCVPSDFTIPILSPSK